MKDKNEKKKRIMKSASKLSQIMGNEHNLARDHMRRLEQGLPPGHPLEGQIRMEKSRMNDGELSGLPVNHPLVIAMQEAYERYSQQQKEDSGEEKEDEKNFSEKKKAKRLEKRKVNEARRSAEDELKKNRVASATTVNNQIDTVVTSLDTLFGTLNLEKEKFDNDPYLRARLKKLERLIQAMHRGLSESRLSTRNL